MRCYNGKWLGYHLPDRITKPAKMVQTPTAGVLFLWVCRDSRVSAQGVQPLVAAKPPYRSAGESSLCGDTPSAERTRPQGCISAPFVPKGIIRFSRPRCVFSDKPALPRSSGQAGERPAASSSVMVLASGTMLSKTAPRTTSRWLRRPSLLGITFAATPFPDFQAAGFSSSRPQSRLAIPRVFFLGSSMGGHSFLPVGIEKGQSISSAVLLIRVFGLLRSAQ